MNSARDTSAMDTLPLNGNFNNSYSLRKGNYNNGVQVVDCGLSLDDTAFEKMIISELVHNNLRACSKSHRSEPHVTTKRGAGTGSGEGVANTSTLVRVGGEGEQLVGGLSLRPHHPQHQRPSELEAPLIPQRTHSLLYHTQERGRADSVAPPPPATYTTQLPAQTEGDLQSPNRDSLYASLPNLSDSPLAKSGLDVSEDLSPSKQSVNEDVYYKSMPNLGAGQQLQACYQINRGSSDGYIIPITKEDSVPEGDVREGQMQLVTSL